jgi:hypothetical protein
MKAFVTLVVFLCLILAIIACSNNDSLSPTKTSGKTETILGLAENHTNLYQQFDSLVSYSPVYHVAVDTSLVSYTVTDVDSNGTFYDISISSEKLARLIITSNSVVVTGYYQKIENQDSLFHFIFPAEIMPNQMAKDETWDFYCTPIHRDGVEMTTSFLNYGFGYKVTRTYLGQEEIVVPAGSYEAHVIKSEYRLPYSEEIVKTDTEYLVAGIGLIRMYSVGNFGSTHVLMIQTNQQ